MQNTTGTIPKTFIALPVYGIDPLFAQSVLHLALDKRFCGGIRWEIGDSSPSRARNNLVQVFLETDCEQLLFIDSDIVFKPEQVIDICSRPELVVGGFYMAKQDGPVKPIFNSFEPGQSPPMRPDGLQKVRYMGTGFLRIKRAVFEMMINKYPEIVYQQDEAPIGTFRYAFFEEKVYKWPNGYSRFLTEDWLFCQRCLDMGVDVYGDMREEMLLIHRGTVAFPLNSQRQGLFGPAPAPALPVASPLPVVPTGGARQANATDKAQEMVAPAREIKPAEAVEK